MIDWISNWTQGIVVSVIIGTLIEMILPDGNCKKYIKVVIGIYILSSIITPVVSKITGKDVKLSDVLDLNEYVRSVESGNDKLYNSLDNNNLDNIREIYIESMKNDIKNKLLSKGYEMLNIQLDIENNEELTIKSIELILNKVNEEDEKIKEIGNDEIINIPNIEINVNENIEQKIEKQDLSQKEIKKIKEYLSMVYEINEKKITIN